MLAGLVTSGQGHERRMRDRQVRHASCCTTQLQHEKRIYAGLCDDRFRPNQKQPGRTMFMKRLSILAAGLLIGAAALQFSSVASGQSDGWVTLVDSNKMGDWTEVGKANWAMKDGALVADKLTDGKDPSYLVSKKSYKDFQIKAEFWADDDANSGIFIRCDQSAKIDCQDLLRGQHLRQAARSDLRHRRDRRCRQGRPDAEGRRQMEHLSRSRPGPASCRRAQRPEDRRRRRIQSTPAARSRFNTARAW